MSNPYRKTQAGKRGGSRNHAGDHRPVYRRPMERVHANSNSPTGAAIDRATFNHWAAIEETVEDHVVPRKSLTEKLLLGVFPQKTEVEPVPFKQLDKEHYKRTSEQRMISGTDNRTVWRSDRTLLERAKGGGGAGSPEIGSRVASGAYGFVRETSHSKRRKVEIEDQNKPIDISNQIDIEL